MQRSTEKDEKKKKGVMERDLNFLFFAKPLRPLRLIFFSSLRLCENKFYRKERKGSAKPQRFDLKDKEKRIKG